ncbi:hypothetical protein GGP77_002970 [Salinibacter ruber]|nr:hypothetical protein [Salinibacter ruber]
METTGTEKTEAGDTAAGDTAEENAAKENAAKETIAKENTTTGEIEMEVVQVHSLPEKFRPPSGGAPETEDVPGRPRN